MVNKSDMLYALCKMNSSEFDAVVQSSGVPKTTLKGSQPERAVLLVDWAEARGRHNRLSTTIDHIMANHPAPVANKPDDDSGKHLLDFTGQIIVASISAVAIIAAAIITEPEFLYGPAKDSETETKTQTDQTSPSTKPHNTIAQLPVATQDASQKSFEEAKAAFKDANKAYNLKDKASYFSIYKKTLDCYFNREHHSRTAIKERQIPKIDALEKKSTIPDFPFTFRGYKDNKVEFSVWNKTDGAYRVIIMEKAPPGHSGPPWLISTEVSLNAHRCYDTYKISRSAL